MGGRSMEGFSNWDREEPFDPFTVMLFKGLQVVAFMFFLAYLAINTDAKQGKVEKINPKVEVIYYERLTLDHTGDEKTAVRFTIGADGKVTDINTRQKSLIHETRKVRSNIIPVTGAAQHQ